MDWMLLPLKRYADFRGRSCRREFWMFQLLNIIVGVLGMVLALVGMPAPDAYGQAAEPSAFVSVIFFVIGIYFLVVLIPSLAVEVRRWHDLGKSGWFWFVRFVPIVGGLIVLYFMCQRGVAGPNEYGADPLDPGQAGVFA